MFLELILVSVGNCAAGEAVADCRTILTQSQFTPLWFQCSLNYRTLSSKPQPIIDLTCPATLPPTPPGPPPTHQPDQGPLQPLHGAVHPTHQGALHVFPVDFLL